MLARAKRKRESSSDAPSGSTFSAPSVKVVAKEGEKQLPAPALSAGISARLRMRTPVVNVNTHDVSLPPNFLTNEGLANGIWPDVEKLLFLLQKNI